MAFSHPALPPPLPSEFSLAHTPSGSYRVECGPMLPAVRWAECLHVPCPRLPLCAFTYVHSMYIYMYVCMCVYVFCIYMYVCK